MPASSGRRSSGSWLGIVIAAIAAAPGVAVVVLCPPFSDPAGAAA